MTEGFKDHLSQICSPDYQEDMVGSTGHVFVQMKRAAGEVYDKSGDDGDAPAKRSVPKLRNFEGEEENFEMSGGMMMDFIPHLFGQHRHGWTAGVFLVTSDDVFTRGEITEITKYDTALGLPFVEKPDRAVSDRPLCVIRSRVNPEDESPPVYAAWVSGLAYAKVGGKLEHGLRVGTDKDSTEGVVNRDGAGILVGSKKIGGGKNEGLVPLLMEQSILRSQIKEADSTKNRSSTIVNPDVGDEAVGNYGWAFLSDLIAVRAVIGGDSRAVLNADYTDTREGIPSAGWVKTAEGIGILANFWRTSHFVDTGKDGDKIGLIDLLTRVHFYLTEKLDGPINFGVTSADDGKIPWKGIMMFDGGVWSPMVRIEPCGQPMAMITFSGGFGGGDDSGKGGSGGGEITGSRAGGGGEISTIKSDEGLVDESSFEADDIDPVTINWWGDGGDTIGKEVENTHNADQKFPQATRNVTHPCASPQVAGLAPTGDAVPRKTYSGLAQIIEPNPGVGDATDLATPSPVTIPRDPNWQSMQDVLLRLVKHNNEKAQQIRALKIFIADLITENGLTSSIQFGDGSEWNNCQVVSQSIPPTASDVATDRTFQITYNNPVDGKLFDNNEVTFTNDDTGADVPFATHLMQSTGYKGAGFDVYDTVEIFPLAELDPGTTYSISMAANDSLASEWGPPQQPGFSTTFTTQVSF